VTKETTEGPTSVVVIRYLRQRINK